MQLRRSTSTGWATRGIGAGAGPTGHIAISLGTSFTADGGSSVASIVEQAGVLTGADGDTTHLVGTRFNSAIVTQTATESIAVVAQIRIDEPAIVDNLTGNVTRAASLWIPDVPSEAPAGGNSAIYMPAGALEVSDGQGASGEQLASGGVDGNLTWTAASSQRSSKESIVANVDTAAALARIVAAPIYNFKYKKTEFETITMAEGTKIKQAKKGKRYASTGDYKKTYLGVMADEAPWAMHHDGTILDPISTFGHTVLSIQELEKQIRQLETRLASLESEFVQGGL